MNETHETDAQFIDDWLVWAAQKQAENAAREASAVGVRPYEMPWSEIDQ